MKLPNQSVGVMRYSLCGAAGIARSKTTINPSWTTFPYRISPRKTRSPVSPGFGFTTGRRSKEALCCASCKLNEEGEQECSGCVENPTFSVCHGKILACEEGEILDEFGGGICA